MRRKSTTKEGAIQVFLPHHAVFKESSTTTKTRVVFDASSKGARDISKMYRQIFVHEDQTALQSILWREDPTTDIEEYELLTITYGTKPASFLAVRCLHQLAELEKEKFPKAAEVVLKDFYIDDLLTGGNSIEEVKELKNQLIGLLAKGGFELHKWNTNVVDTKEKDPNKRTRIRWNPSSDAFHYEVESRDHEKRTTKRTMLSQICKLFDPLGLVGPIITLAKILMQKLWSLGLDWDESVPMSIYKEWHQLKSQLNLLNRLKIPRAIMIGNTGTRIQLHGFCDASEKAYGACVYIREQIASDKIGIALVCSKSRVAPMKTLSLPRLELCGAVLLANLMKRVLDSLNIKISQRYFWCDSKIVITWIRSSSRKWQTFVANRASEIQSISSPSEWHHIKSKENPADLISRGETSEHLINTKLWWQGLPWLQANEETWPMEGEELLLTNAPEMRKQAVIAITTKEEPLLDYNRHSTLVKLINIVAYMLRFIENTKCKNENKEAKLGKITLQEKRKAKLRLIKLIQTEEYNEELNALQAKNKVSLKSKLKTLHPFLDDEGVIRVGGRLQQASLPEGTKHPIVIPAAHHFTTLVINHYHEKLLHVGAQTMLYAIREEFWPIQARNKIKKIIRQCVKCRKANPTVGWQLMGQLPSVRVNAGRPFLSSGVDYCRPFQVRDRIRRNAKAYKAYVAIFVCMSTKAVHIELVEDLTAESFIAALKRFVSRRGRASDLYSDNGTNFVGAERILREIMNTEEFKNLVQEYATSEQINWHFIPARSPHCGGIWEAAVRSMKLHLKRIIGETCLTVAEMNTVLTQVEAILNSRPLTAISDDVNDMRALTPGHFLIGESLQDYPEQNMKEIPINRLAMWQHIEQLRQHFWSRWQKEYLVTCQERNKWRTEAERAFKVGQLVMLKQTESMPLKWTLARIEEIHPGTDGLVRVVTVRTEKDENVDTEYNTRDNTDIHNLTSDEYVDTEDNTQTHNLTSDENVDTEDNTGDNTDIHNLTSDEYVNIKDNTHVHNLTSDDHVYDMCTDTKSNTSHNIENEAKINIQRRMPLQKLNHEDVQTRMPLQELNHEDVQRKLSLQELNLKERYNLRVKCHKKGQKFLNTDKDDEMIYKAP
ncbi:uncharacterized protein LOC105197924 [Solenopsis invicta]|uniref:uncharacterized protein LOC105197924 n=1 Tax=Solenopsis invicta TaxID=13686 RepID=UPI00193CC3B9|nr:uncharacterized protein LOC105197924 [Solenopsis invicta]